LLGFSEAIIAFNCFFTVIGLLLSFFNQFLKYNCEHLNDKIGMLILDVKGNFYSYVSSVAKKYNLQNDLFVISLYKD